MGGIGLFTETGTEVTQEQIIFGIFIVLLCAVLVLLIGQKLRMPVIIGYFITGIIVGPYGLCLISQNAADLLADFGVILLMFTIGMEISLKNLLAMKKIVLIGGCIQLFATTAVVCGIMMLVGFTFNTSLFIGFLVAHSSTAIIMSIYQKSGEVDQEHGKISLGLLIFQDLNVVPMMMLIPLFAISDGGSSADVNLVGQIVQFLIGMAIMVGLLILAIYFVPKILKHIALKRNGEIFVIAIVVIVFGIAWLMNLNGVSLALGAFLAGIAISQSDYSHEIIGQVTPIRDILVSFFFVSIGMMLNIPLLFSNILIVILLALGLIVLKFGINFISVKVLKISTAACLLSAIGLSQIGEFSFILGKECVANNIISDDVYQVFLAISIITMALTPFLVKFAPKVINKLVKPKVSDKETLPVMKKPHVIIVGYGLTGYYVATSLKKAQIPYIIIENNTKTVEREKQNGENIVFGDASREPILEYAKINQAKSIVITIPIMESVKAIISTARRMNPNITIITRSRFIGEMEELYNLGTDEVIVDEREAAIRIYKRILLTNDIPKEEIAELSKEIRNSLHNKFIKSEIVKSKEENNKSPKKPSKVKSSVKSTARKVDKVMSREMNKVITLEIQSESPACGHKLKELNLRKEYGVSVITIKHSSDNDIYLSPSGQVVLDGGDSITLIGNPKALNNVSKLFEK